MDIYIHISKCSFSSNYRPQVYTKGLAYVPKPNLSQSEIMKNYQTKLPPTISHWFGVRTQPPPAKPLWVSLLWAFVGAFCGLSLLQAVFGHAAYFIDRGVPQLVASYVSCTRLTKFLFCHNVIDPVCFCAMSQKKTKLFRA